MNETLDCQKISEGHLADLYAMGRLSGTEAEAFEDHYMLCETCVAELEQAELRVKGFKRLGAQAVADFDLGTPANEPEAPAPASFEAARARRTMSWSRAGALAASVGLAVAALSLFLSGSGIEQGSSVTVFHLQAERSAGEAAPAHQVDLAADHAVLALELDPPFYERYRATLRQEGRTLWRTDGLTLGQRDTVHLSFDAGELSAADHVLSLEGWVDGRWVEAGRFPFSAVHGR